MKNKKKIVISGIFIFICTIIGMTNIEKNMAAGINNTLSDKMISCGNYSYGEDNSLSSNPYEYIKNSSEYENIIKLGKESLPQLKKILETHDSGLSSYIIALAMEEIAEVKISEETNIDWATSKEFLKAWNVYEEKNGIIDNNIRIKRSTPKRSNPHRNEELILPYRFSNFYKKIICRDCEKAKFDENYKDSFGNKRQFGIKFCNYHINNTSPNAEFVAYGYTDYNCLAYALGEIGPCNWMWPSSWGDKPSVETVKEYFIQEGYIAEEYSEEKQHFYNEKKTIYVYGIKENDEIYVVHFARNDLIDGGDIGEYAQVSKWGMGGIYKIKDVNGYVSKSGYGECVLACYK